uniref:TIR domain-containing protein n=1 Tax=Brassica oleracea var. oleracea TaxID=109376 RepID=A0A0D3BW16_BRAOL
MAKSMRCKRVKRLKAIRREIVEKESFTLTREDAKSAAMAVALAAPKLPGRLPPPSSIMEVAAPTSESASVSANVMGEEINPSLVAGIEDSAVDLSHIRKQSGRFVEDFETHAKRFEDEEIHPWRGAMKIVGNLPGYLDIEDELNQGLDKIRGSVYEKKILVVLDDVDNVDQVDALVGERSEANTCDRRSEDMTLCVVIAVPIGVDEMGVELVLSSSDCDQTVLPCSIDLIHLVLVLSTPLSRPLLSDLEAPHPAVTCC